MKTILKSLVGSVLIAICANANAATMENVFNELNGSTSYGGPAAIQTQTMNYYHGGNLSLATPSRSYNLASLQAPTVNAGCGGIDLHMGGFSFISKEQFVQAMRNIGSNALGYGFKIALQNICPTCENVMTSLQNIADRVNQFNINSCQAAKGIVHAASNEVFNTQYDTRVMEWGMVDGIYRDGADAYRSVKNIMSREGRQKALERVRKSHPERKEEMPTGNITWSALSKVQGLSETEKRIFMGMVGTVILKEDGTINAYLAKDDFLVEKMISSRVQIPFAMPKCLNDDCTQVDWNVTKMQPSFKMLVEKRMKKMRDHISNRTSYGADRDELLAFVNSTEIPVYKIVSLVSTLNNSPVTDLTIEKYSDLIAAKYAQAYINIVAGTLRRALQDKKIKEDSAVRKEHAEELLDHIEKLERKLALNMESLYNAAQTSYIVAQEVKMLEQTMLSGMTSSIANSLQFGNSLR